MKKKNKNKQALLCVVFVQQDDLPEKGLSTSASLKIPIYAVDPSREKKYLPSHVRRLSCEILEKGLKVTDHIDSEWALFLEEDEALTSDTISKLKKALPTADKVPHLISVSRLLPLEDIKQFGWVTTARIFESPSENMRAYHKMELRLLPAECINRTLIEFTPEQVSQFRLTSNLENGEIHEHKFLPVSVPRVEIDLSENLWEQPDDKEMFLYGHGKYFKDIEFAEGFEWPRTMYVLIRNEHIPGIMRGLQEGITPRSIGMYSLRYLLRLGNFDQAAQILPLIPEHWEFGDPIILQMKAMTYYLSGRKDLAIKLFEECFRASPDNPLILENLGKVCLLLGEEQAAKEFFQKCLLASEECEKVSHVKRFLDILEENQGRKATLSACLICKDEEALLTRALQTLTGFADEIILVDTGSSDRTKEIASTFGARTFDYTWKNDFSAVRNFATEQSNSDYILVLDADEYLYATSFVDFHVMKKLLPLKSPHAFALAVGHFKVETDWLNVLAGGGNFTTETSSVRIFPKIRGVHYSGKIAEDISESLKNLNIPVISLPSDQMRIHHSVLDRERRVHRKLPIYAKEVNPSLVQILSAIKDFSFLSNREGLIEWLTRFIEKGLSENFPSVTRMGTRLAALLEDDAPDRANSVLEKLFHHFPRDSEVLMALSSFYLRNAAFDNLSKLPFPAHNGTDDLDEINASPEFKIYEGIGALERGEIGKTAELLDEVLSSNNYHLLGQAARFYLLCRVGDLDSAALALQDLMEISSGNTINAIEDVMDFLISIESLSNVFGQWGHRSERSLLLHGALILKEQLGAVA